MAAANTQLFVILVITTSRRRRNQRFTMSANCLNKNYKLNKRNLSKIQVTQKLQNTGAGIVSNSPKGLEGENEIPMLCSPNNRILKPNDDTIRTNISTIASQRRFSKRIPSKPGS